MSTDTTRTEAVHDAVSAGTPITDGPVLAERRGHVLLVTLNRPEARNAVNQEMCLVVGDLLEEADAAPDIRAVVLTGAGDKAFCAGADLKAISRGEPILPPGREHWGFLGWATHPISTPTICAVNGTAVGGGTELALAGDLVVAAETASFGLPEVKRGLIAGAGGAFRIVEQLPHRVGLELVMTGEPISASRALELNLVNRVVPAERVLDTALELAGVIAANAPLAVQASKRIALGIRDGRIPAEVEAWQLTADEIARNRRSADAAEGPRAFAEKRPPVWTGR
ncbi:enoyl-CoA hydratase-related protein [Pseudonocardia pini]|uniref:enoyl-CoA hydratase-related protein n=1 Tax=Pseudonocardia pini TaxID=2758030 RepID=UPI0015F0969B|nr:enoyl-CoA hydratase-related protein [Pseudonocardia pini]